MMLHTSSNGNIQGSFKQSCSILAVLCDSSKLKEWETEDRQRYPFPELESFSRLEVRTLRNPSLDEFGRTLESSKPNVVYLQGQVLPNDEIGSLVWDGVDMSDAEVISEVFNHVLPTTVYLEIPNGEKLANAIHSKGVPYVMFWRNAFSCYAAAHFRHAFFSAVQSTPCHTWDAFQLAHASFSLYCIRNNAVVPRNSQMAGCNLGGPSLLGEAPIVEVALPEADDGDEEDGSGSNLSAVKIHDDEVSVRFLICGVACSLDAYLLGCLEDGLNALLGIEIRGSKLQNRFSAPPPPLQAGTFSRGVVTMKCDISTCSAAHISVLVSGSAQTCFDDQQLENHIKKEAIERSQLIQAVPSSEEIKLPSSEPRTSDSIACGATVFEVCLKAPSWALQVLRQLAPETSYHSLVALGIASIQGLAVASFQKDDAERLLFFCANQDTDRHPHNDDLTAPPSWLRPPPPSRKISGTGQGSSPCSHDCYLSENQAATTKAEQEDKGTRFYNGTYNPAFPIRQKIKVAAMRPIPQSNIRKMMPFTGIVQADNYDTGQVKLSLPALPPTKHSVLASNPAPNRRATNAFQAKQIISLNPIPLKKHGCGRPPIQLCSEDEFLKDVMQFLMHRGHSRLIPQGGLAEFPDAILNSKRLDLYNLYREVVSRGGFHVGNGINWKGQVFSKMRNYTATNKMTGVGNTLKRHYETYLLEYELAHDDVDGECCLLCHSSAAGDWVNCGICGEWAHFGCDRRQGLGAFKDYAKTDGLEYICPHCSVTNFRKKLHKPSNGFSESLAYSRHV
ncbi:AT-rich interactive domain-containing protein 4-like [Chenopodium quinoa]|uniref:AT-rich interactive domain-containing protein 4-like n=1 Tax=Chenopodium quinoa TaxID=63459 RepID=UPI000B77EF73|nr:AT-rich interactive domain-containing protein 4-like [Chenopodium quinoa]